MYTDAELKTAMLNREDEALEYFFENFIKKFTPQIVKEAEEILGKSERAFDFAGHFWEDFVNGVPQKREPTKRRKSGIECYDPDISTLKYFILEVRLNNSILEFLRANRREIKDTKHIYINNPGDNDDEFTHIQIEPISNDDPEKEVAYRQSKEIIETEISRLEILEQKVVKCLFYLDLTVKETSIRLKISTNQINNIKHNKLKKIGERLREMGMDFNDLLWR